MTPYTGVPAMKSIVPARIVTFFTVATLLVSVSIARADEDADRESLARINAELEHVQQMVADAQRHATDAPRVKFRYDWLQRDLDMMRSGIDAHLDSPRQPRPAPPLKGDYRQ